MFRIWTFQEEIIWTTKIIEKPTIEHRKWCFVIALYRNIRVKLKCLCAELSTRNIHEWSKNNRLFGFLFTCINREVWAVALRQLPTDFCHTGFTLTFWIYSSSSDMRRNVSSCYEECTVCCTNWFHRRIYINTDLTRCFENFWNPS